MPKYDNLYSRFSNNKMGIIDKTGKEIIPFKYNAISSYHNRLAKVYLNEKFGFIDKKGEEVIPCIYDEAYDFNEGTTLVRLNGNGF